MEKILLTASVQSHIAQFHKPLIELLKNEYECEISVAARDNLHLKNGLKLSEPDKIFDIGFERNPFSIKNIAAYKKLKTIIKENKYDVIHCNTPAVSVLTRLAARKERKKGVKVIYTAHGFHFFKGAPLFNWLIYYPVERFLARFTDVLITINKEDYERAKKFKCEHAAYIPGVGVDIDKFAEVNISKKEKRAELDIPDNAVVVLSIGELNKNKNHKVVIDAVSKLENVYYIICGNGVLESSYKEYIKSLNCEKRIKLLGYRRDIPEICAAADIFALPSKREGLGLAAIEAMCAGLPLVTSDIHGIVDYSENGVTGYTCSSSDVTAFRENIKKLAENKILREKMGLRNRETAKKYDVKNCTAKLKEIYKAVLFNKF
jgi:glycosyltransferase EpsD